jgi:4-hydroxy-4-methyl-2-oxoglutarate aldolase
MTATTHDVHDYQQRLLAIDTGHICDALSHLGCVSPQLPDVIRPFTKAVKFAGPAATIRLVRTRSVTEPRRLIELIDRHIHPGTVVVVDADGCTEWSVFGARMALRTKLQGGLGAVVNGSIRDIEAMNDLEFPVHALGRSLLASEGRFRSIAMDAEVTIQGVLIAGGDWLVGDSSGICVIPQAMLDEVVHLAEERERIDQDTLQSILAGGTLADAHRHFEDDLHAHDHRHLEDD